MGQILKKLERPPEDPRQPLLSVPAVLKVWLEERILRRVVREPSKLSAAAQSERQVPQAKRGQIPAWL